MRNKIILSFIGIFLLTFLLDTSYLVSQKLEPPAQVHATVGHDDAGTFALLKWYYVNSGEIPDGFYIYMAKGKTSDLTQFEFIEKVKWMDNVREFSKKFYLGKGTYTFYIQSFKVSDNETHKSSNSNFAYAIIEDKEPNTPYIKIVSNPVISAEQNSLYKYQVKAQTNLPQDCPLVYRLIESPEGMEIDEKTGLIKWATGAAGEFHVVVEVGTHCKINVEFAYQKFTIKVGTNQNDAYVRITSVPEPNGYVGKPYQYQVKAVSNIRCPILYEFIGDLPDNAKFDKENGLFVFLSDVPTEFSGAIKAYLECDDKVSTIQHFKIKIIAGQDNRHCAEISGKVYFNSNELVKDGFVIAYQLTDKSNYLPQFKGKIENGQYKIFVPEGTYLLRFEGAGFKAFWYENSQDMNNATKIEIACNEKIEINVMVEKVPEPKHYTVSGRVYSEDDDSGILALVEFIPIQQNNNRDKAHFVVKTDADGYYKISLPDIHTYRAHAIPQVRGWHDQWYEKAPSQYEADLIYLDSDLDGVDFPLSQFEHNKGNGFSGRVVDANNESIFSVVYAIPVIADRNKDKRVQAVTKTRDDGNFYFENLPFGDYVLLSVPADIKYIPGYFKMSDFVVRRWREATRITVGENMIEIIYEIMHRERTGLRGIMNVNGEIRANGSTLTQGDSPQGLLAIEDALVYVIDENGTVTNFTFSDIYGAFQIDELPAGSLRIVVDKVGFNTFETLVDLDLDESFTKTIDVQLSPEALASADEYDFSGGLKVYPVPAYDYINISTELLTGDFLISVVDIMGKEVLRIQPEASQPVKGIDVSSLNTGTYMLRLVSGQKVMTGIINIVR